ncbi:hypothetical protein [Luteolibacter sp. Populi]|uniref:hypothetical protein n=1 Tax=Luteolibacter sp. Populi TaxID=3230487 RepID=UPI0034675B81
MKLALHRSLLFWFGLFGAMFLLWSWVDSMHAMAGASRHVDIREVHPPPHPSPPWEPGVGEFYGHTGGRIQLAFVVRDQSGNLKVESRKITMGRHRFVPPDSRWFPLPGVFKDEPWPFPSGASYTFTIISIPHWLVLLLYLAAWSAVLTWRSRRMRRIELRSRRPLL